MLPQKPYIIKSFYQWIVDSHCTPYLLVNAMLPGVNVPQDYIEDGEIVLNISPLAIRNLHLENAAITFQARFAGQPMNVAVPMKAILAIYANENGRGMVFNAEHDEGGDDDNGSSPSGGKAPVSKSKTTLRVIK